MPKIMKVAQEVAEEEFQRILDFYEIEFEDPDSDVEGEDGTKVSRAKLYSEIKRSIIKAICSGAVIMNDDGKPQFTPRYSSSSGPLVFSFPSANVLIEMDKRQDHEKTRKAASGLSGITGEDIKTFIKMDLRDLNVCNAFFTLLAVIAQ